MCGVLNSIKTHPQEMRNMFVASSQNILRADQGEWLFEISQDAWSAPCSNKHRDEKRVHGFWRDFLLDLESNMMY